MNILIIEDDPKVQLFLKESLEADFSPITTLGYFPNESDLKTLDDIPHTIILDRLIGNFDSKSNLVQLRKKFPNAFIIILSAINNPAERSELLDLGADDYMGKPFSVVELKARIRAMNRRSTKVEQLNYVKLDTTILDLNQRSLSLGEKRVSLSSKEYELFYIFSKNIGRVYSKFELMDKVW